MKTNKATAHFDVYQTVTDRIIAQLEQNKIPWRQPWTNTGPPANLITKRLYRGINVLLLNGLAYTTNYFLGWHQLKSIGGSVKKGEKGYLIVFWKRITDGNDEETENEDAPYKAVLRYHTVFNVAQCIGIPDNLIPAKEEQLHHSIAACEEIIECMPNAPLIKHERHSAFYYPPDDYINMPEQGSFESVDAYYSVLFHELVHSTGHGSRLNRKEVTEINSFGSEPYSIEELTAEIGTTFLQSMAGLQPQLFDNSIAYINSWLRRLKDDKRLIVHASSRAQRAVDYITNVSSPDLVEMHSTGTQDEE